MTHELPQIEGYDAAAYARRQKGYSPEPIRDAAWRLVGDQVAGIVLDAGSGEGGWIRRLQQSERVTRIVSCDIVDDGAGQLPDVEFHIADLSQSCLPCAAEALDWIFAIEVIEHLANPRHFVREAARCLKRRGRLLVTTPCNESVRAKLSFLLRGYFPAFGESDYRGAGHITPITELDLRRMASEAGFADVSVVFPLPGRVPKIAIEWQSILPFMGGKAWSDCLFAVLTR